jgi:hypothetical protein
VVFRLVVFVLVLVLAAPAPVPALAAAPALGIQGERFTKNGAPDFLIFVSYFDALRSSDRSGDLEFFSRHVDGVRIFATWWSYACDGSESRVSHAEDTIFDASGAIREAYWPRFESFLDAAGSAGLIVDVSFSRDTVAKDMTPANFTKGIRAVAERLKNSRRHVYFDIQNEWDDNLLSEEGVRATVAAVKAVDPGRLVTASGARKESPFLGAPQDFFAVHDRGTGWAEDATVNSLLNGSPGVRGWRSYGVPVHLQEPDPFNELCPRLTEPANPGVWNDAVRNARKNGAAAWTFHTRTGFALGGTSFVGRMGAVEKATIAALRTSAATVGWGLQAPPKRP